MCLLYLLLSLLIVFAKLNHLLLKVIEDLSFIYFKCDILFRNILFRINESKYIRNTMIENITFNRLFNNRLFSNKI